MVSVPQFLDAVQAALESRPGLSGVLISGEPLGADLPPEAIIIAGARTESTESGFVPGAQITRVEIGTWVLQQGAGEDVAKAARNRAYELFAEIVSEARENPTLNSSVPRWFVEDYEYQPGATPDGRWASISAHITANIS